MGLLWWAPNTYECARSSQTGPCLSINTPIVYCVTVNPQSNAEKRSTVTETLIYTLTSTYRSLGGGKNRANYIIQTTHWSLVWMNAFFKPWDSSWTCRDTNRQSKQYISPPHPRNRCKPIEFILNLVDEYLTLIKHSWFSCVHMVLLGHHLN